MPVSLLQRRKVSERPWFTDVRRRGRRTYTCFGVRKRFDGRAVSRSAQSELRREDAVREWTPDDGGEPEPTAALHSARTGFITARAIRVRFQLLRLVRQHVQPSHKHRYDWTASRRRRPRGAPTLGTATGRTSPSVPTTSLPNTRFRVIGCSRRCFSTTHSRPAAI